MKILLVLIALVAAIQAQDAASALPPIEIEFKEYQKKYNKTYACPELEELRFNIYKSNVREIEEHNEQYDHGSSTFKVGINKFADRLNYEDEGMPIKHLPPLGPIKIQFEEFKKNYSRKYGCPEEEELRFKIFQHNVEEIEEHNKEYEAGKVTWEMGINNLADMAGDELLPFLGAILHNHKHSVF